MKLLILGHAGHGKDTVAEMLAGMLHLKFSSSSVFVFEKAVLPTFREKYGYATVEECYANRDQHREELRMLIKQYNTPDLTRLTRELLAENDIYVGLRDADEFAATRHLYNRIFWVDALIRKGTVDPSMKIKYERSFEWVDNNGSLSYTTRQLTRLADSLRK